MSASYFPTQCTPTVEEAPDFDPNADAEALRTAMRGMGTDEDAIINIIPKRSVGQRLDIIVAYKTLFGKDLVKDLRSELSGKFEDVIVALMMPLPEFYATELHDAIKGLGTDEDALIEILVTLGNYGIRTVAEHYRRLFKNTLEKDLIGDTSGNFRRLCVSLSVGNRDENPTVDARTVAGDAEALYKAGEGKWGTDESVFNAILVSKSYIHLQQVFIEYERIAGHTIEAAIEKEFSGDVRSGLLSLAKCIKNRTGFFAEKLYKSMKGLGTNNKTLIRIIVGRSEIDLGNIKEAFLSKYEKTLEEWVEGDTSGNYKKILLSILEGNQ